MVEKEGKGYILTSIGQDSGEIPYTTYFAKKSYIEKNPETIQKLINAVYKGQKWVQESSAADVAAAIQDSFPDTDLDILTTVIERYKSIDVWNDTPFLKQEAFDRLQTVMTSAGELKQNAPYDLIVNNSFAEKAIETIQ